MRTIEICDVGPRDGLQNAARIWSVAERIEFIDRLSAAGLPRIEAVSFVNPKRVPQMADPEAVMAGIKRPEGVQIAGLALNARGAERAIAAGVDEVRYVVIASETFNQRNQGREIAETLKGYDDIAAQVTGAGIKLSAAIGAAFGCPFEGEVPLEQVVRLAKRLAAGGAGEIGLADSIGSGVPPQVKERFGAVRDAVGADMTLGCHFHNTRNTGFANAAAAVEAGVKVFDSSLGGIGGCPFAPKATGNIATEDLGFMLRNMGLDTGLDLEALLDTAAWVEGYFEEPLPGLVMKAGLFPEVAAKEAAE
ncbi:MAG TPA: hydroxymethylglutaryl-CoA lyase [Alphaproteobacteria bacterium]|nr:hydroxymethylglutaryl-CoA lyase [Alphaproteobacteria bacterium]HJM48465.1 hydroxymethylglutaryl-CoA lyase [Alphaproteobacteria bacterium]